MPDSLDSNTFTIATWNILINPVQILERMEEAAAWMEDVDILFVQEALHMETGSLSSAHILAHLLGMEVAALSYEKSFSYGQDIGSGTAILTKFPVEVQKYIDLSEAGGSHQDASLALLTTPSGTPIYAVSAHLDWGGHAEPIRLRQAKAIERECAARSEEYLQVTGKPPLILMGADLNTKPESDTVRYLTGLTGTASASSALWVDIWETVGDGPGYTSRVDDNPHVLATAKSKNVIKPELIPPRRIDYLFARGWVYGSTGSPISAELIGGSSKLGVTHASDHLGIKARLLDLGPR